jgi:glycosyltransferase involved in cell wall biosynthesis
MVEMNYGESERPVRVLHSVGHLLRGGIEKWLFQTLPPQLSSHCEHHVLVRTASDEPFTASFHEAGIPVLACPNYKNPFRYAADLKKLVEENGPYDILHVHGSSFSGLLTLALAKRVGIKRTIIHSHNDVRPHLQDRGFAYAIYVTGVRMAYRALADRGLAASVLAAESMFGESWKDDQRWRLLYYGVDSKPFARPKDPNLRARLGIPNGAFVLGHVGRFHEQKNHEFLIEIVAAAQKTRPEVHCLLIGDGPLREEIRADIRRRGLENHFTFVADTMSVSDYMIGAMDCFVFPSRYEGLGLVVVEAQAAGLPCVISDRVPVEAVVDNELVRLLPLEKAPEHWANVVLEMGQHKSVDHAKAMARVKNSRFDLDHCIDSLHDLYVRLARPSTVGPEGKEVLI